jgi:hypothetical protein
MRGSTERRDRHRRLIDMRAQCRSRPGLRHGVVAALLLAVLTLAFGGTAHASAARAHAGHGKAVLSSAGIDLQHGAARADAHGALPVAAAQAARLPRRSATADSYQPVSSHTAQAPQVRGPPAQPAA